MRTKPRPKAEAGNFGLKATLASRTYCNISADAKAKATRLRPRPQTRGRFSGQSWDRKR